MSFGLLLFAFLAVPLVMVKRGFNPILVGFVLLGVCLTPWLLVGVFVAAKKELPAAAAMAASLSPIFILVSLLWLLISLLTTRSVHGNSE
jgi:hypothetical protein